MNKAIREYEESELKKSFETKSKLKTVDMMKETFEMKEYLAKVNLHSARLKFQMSSKMLDIKFNFSAKYEKELWLCDSCCSVIKTQKHFLVCQVLRLSSRGEETL